MLRRGFFQDFFQMLGSNIAAFFIFLYPKTYPKVSAESVIRTPDPLLVSTYLGRKIFVPHADRRTQGPTQQLNTKENSKKNSTTHPSDAYAPFSFRHHHIAIVHLNSSHYVRHPHMTPRF